ncbi:MOSC domain-containing protein [Altererythrobacter sp.]|uniref:MOSC domain-containing protein n=1 Tax=Altererythrobacter sp. TaxID=1872480 RepID=UPI003CFBCC4E
MIDGAPRVVAVARDGSHRFSKVLETEIRLIAGLGVDGDAHCGEKVQHRSRVAVNPDQPNLRQVHLLAFEVIEEMNGKGYAFSPGDLGENVTTSGIALSELPRGTHLRLGREAVIEITGLRNPCAQIEAFRPGLLGEVVRKGADGAIERRAGIMAVVVSGGIVRPDDTIGIELPPEPHVALERV